MQVSEEMIERALRAAPNFWRDTRNERKHIKKMIEAALAAMWRPISEAPDSETVIVGGGDAVYPVTASWGGHFDEGEGWQVDGQEDIHCEIGWPTHFMPLPQPPRHKEG